MSICTCYSNSHCTRARTCTCTICITPFFRGSEKQPSFDGSELKLANDVDIKDLPEPNVQSVEMSYDVPSSVKKSSGVSHDCSKECWVYGTEYKSWQLYSPLDIPLKLGWKRYMYVY